MHADSKKNHKIERSLTFGVDNDMNGTVDKAALAADSIVLPGD